MEHKEYLIIPSQGRSPKKIFKELANSETLLKGYTRFVMPCGITRLSLEKAMEMYETHDQGRNKVHRNGTSFLLILETDEFFFYVDSESSRPIVPIPVYEVRIDLLGVEYVYEIPTYHRDAVDQALADLFSRVGDAVKNAFVISTKRVIGKPPTARGPF